MECVINYIYNYILFYFFVGKNKSFLDFKKISENLLKISADKFQVKLHFKNLTNKNSDM